MIIGGFRTLPRPSCELIFLSHAICPFQIQPKVSDLWLNHFYGLRSTIISGVSGVSAVGDGTNRLISHNVSILSESIEFMLPGGR